MSRSYSGLATEVQLFIPSEDIRSPRRTWFCVVQKRGLGTIELLGDLLLPFLR